MKVSTASTLAAWVPVVLRCLKHHGMAKQNALTLAGIDPGKLSQQGARYNSQQTHKLMAVLDSTLDVAVPGLELARFTDATSFGALGFAMMASTTLGEALSRLQRFAPVASSVVAFEVYTHDALGEIRIEEGSGAQATPQATFDFTMAIMAGFLRIKGGRRASPKKVHFCHKLSEEQIQDYQSFYGCELKEQQTSYSLFFDAQSLNLPSKSPASQGVSLASEKMLHSSLQQLHANDLPAWLLQKIVESLPNGEPSLATLAQQLHISGRTLQRRLKQHNVYFKDVLDEGRQTLSRGYLKQGYSVTETAYLLGFADTSSFSRAYRRWFNKAPSEQD